MMEWRKTFDNNNEQCVFTLQPQGHLGLYLRKLCVERVGRGGGRRGQGVTFPIQWWLWGLALWNPGVVHATAVLQMWNCQVVVSAVCLLFVCAVCLLFVCAVCFLFACAVCFLFGQSVSLCAVCFLFVCTVCFLFVQFVSSLYNRFPLCTVCFALSVQSVSFCLCSLFPSLPQWWCGTNNGHIYTLSAALHATLFKISFVSHTQSQKQKVRQASETECEKQKQVWKAPVMYRNLYSTPIDRTRDVS